MKAVKSKLILVVFTLRRLFFVMRLNRQQQDSLKLYISLASCQESLEIEVTIKCRFTLKRERDMIITYRRLNRLNNLVDSINMQKLF